VINMQTDQLTLPNGLVGLPDLTRFTIEPVDDGPLLELVSTDEPGFGFLAMAGEIVRPGLGALLVERGLVTPGEEILVVLSIHGDPPAVTANLAGPIVVSANGSARQLVVEDPDLPLRAPVDTATA
jgi:flagellar assembly factor FliW